jgi:allophanate hydrolase
MTEVCFDLSWLRAAYRAGQITPATVVTEVLRRIDAAGDDAVWISRRTHEAIVADTDTLVRRPNALDRLPLYGLPFAVKDSIDVAGLSIGMAPIFLTHPAASTHVGE